MKHRIVQIKCNAWKMSINDVLYRFVNANLTLNHTSAHAWLLFNSRWQFEVYFACLNIFLRCLFILFATTSMVPIFRLHVIIFTLLTKSIRLRISIKNLSINIIDPISKASFWFVSSKICTSFVLFVSR